MANYDLVIAGGGPVAGVLAAMLADTPWQIAMVAPTPRPVGNRAIALNHSSRQILQSLNIWNAVADQAGEINQIEVSRRGEPGKTHLYAADINASQLGWVVPEDRLISAINLKLKPLDNLTTITAAARAVDSTDASISLNLYPPASITTRLTIGADGFASNLRDLAGISFRDHDFNKVAISATVTSSLPHSQRAWERFTNSGPIALLPLTDSHAYSLVWCVDSPAADTLLQCEDDEFMHRLQQAFGDSAGVFSHTSGRELYPLIQRTCDNPSANRLLLIGSAARHLHPVGGQGLNLALRDVAVLADLLNQAARQLGDPGNPALLSQYCQLRRNDWRTTEQFSRRLPGLFAGVQPPLVLGRNLALTAMELIPPLRRAFVRRAAGQLGFRPTSGEQNRKLP